MTAPDRIAGMTLAEWREFARLDNCLDIMVPSELRLLIAAIPEPRATPAVTQPAPTAQLDARGVREAALREAAAVAEYYAEQDYCWMGYPEDGGIAASGTAHTIERDILALIPKGAADDRA